MRSSERRNLWLRKRLYSSGKEIGLECEQITKVRLKTIENTNVKILSEKRPTSCRSKWETSDKEWDLIKESIY